MVNDANDFVLSLVRISGTLATHCDRVEHNEIASRDTVIEMGDALRELASSTSRSHCLDLAALYGARLGAIEAKHPAFRLNPFDGRQGVEQAKTWADLQAVQYMHDVTYHPDVAGLAKYDQLRHYTLHVSKLAKLALEASELHGGSAWVPFLTERLPDLAVFGVKLATVCGHKLPTEPIAASTDC